MPHLRNRRLIGAVHIISQTPTVIPNTTSSTNITATFCITDLFPRFHFSPKKYEENYWNYTWSTKVGMEVWPLLRGHDDCIYNHHWSKNTCFHESPYGLVSENKCHWIVIRITGMLLPKSPVTTSICDTLDTLDLWYTFLIHFFDTLICDTLFFL